MSRRMAPREWSPAALLESKTLAPGEIVGAVVAVIGAVVVMIDVAVVMAVVVAVAGRNRKESSQSARLEGTLAYGAWVALCQARP